MPAIFRPMGPDRPGHPLPILPRGGTLKVARESVISPLILASASPRRQDILGGLGLPFEIRPSAIDEHEQTHFANPAAVRDWVACTATAKAAAVAQDCPAGSWVIGADTVVSLGCELLHKPADEAEARGMISRLQGRTHTVLTAVALVAGGGAVGPVQVVGTQVTFYPLTPAQVAAYVARGESLDKAGAYAAQGFGALLIERYEGCYFNVVGLPVATLARMLAEVGYDVWAVAAGGGG